MADNEVVVVETVKTKRNILRENLMALSEPENFQKYVLGSKKNGEPRALYDVVKDYTKPKKKKKKKKNKDKKVTSYSFYLDNRSKKKKKKKGKKKKYWHI